MIVAPSGDQAAVRDADGALEIVGKRFNAFAAEQWLTADGDGRDPASARDLDAPCDRLGCVAASAGGRIAFASSSIRLAFDEDCERAEVIVSALNAPAELPGEVRVRRDRRWTRLGAVGLTWSDDKGFALTSDRSAAAEPALVARAANRRVTTGWCAPAMRRRTAPIRPTRRTRGGQVR